MYVNLGTSKVAATFKEPNSVLINPKIEPWKGEPITWLARICPNRTIITKPNPNCAEISPNRARITAPSPNPAGISEPSPNLAGTHAEYPY
ncbi:hypothetical protein L484_017514 [Morus notabilis]|uniref:Uncharacterized protein n=1 Tax=Morus notabilis TaxID=981085 RepID=W9QTL6_9ROSA|nr:hypothetical protein L484_017514 [Morus notabilis]